MDAQDPETFSDEAGFEEPSPTLDTANREELEAADTPFAQVDGGQQVRRVPEVDGLGGSDAAIRAKAQQDVMPEMPGARLTETTATSELNKRNYEGPDSGLPAGSVPVSLPAQGLTEQQAQVSVETAIGLLPENRVGRIENPDAKGHGPEAQNALNHATRADTATAKHAVDRMPNATPTSSTQMIPPVTVQVGVMGFAGKEVGADLRLLEEGPSTPPSIMPVNRPAIAQTESSSQAMANPAVPVDVATDNDQTPREYTNSGGEARVTGQRTVAQSTTGDTAPSHMAVQIAQTNPFVMAMQSEVDAEQSIEDDIGFRSVDHVSIQSSESKQSPPARGPEIPRMVSAQISEIIRQQPDRPVELTLSPEELGRLRMSFQSDGSSMHVTLSFERPDTLDLMRRHIDQLAQDLRTSGLSDVSFTFQQQTADGGDGSPSGDGRPGFAETDTHNTLAGPADDTPIVLNVAGQTGVDIRV
ncbi:flagellar hook-length control protein FliK [Aliiroseovarius halocynthiae]|uniref:flagellar hook-length control protein FliK n=1 Tax=Aliiroseovarius halocynthiae TaxID=985055 RepID=UPI00163D9C25|nr:flagellar hook-length control protein FliK [Aliiroseovarius halocynthiae]